MKHTVGKILLMALAVFVINLPALAQEFTQGFATDQKLLKGEIVARVQGDDSKVEKATQSGLDRLYGVVVRSNETAVSLTVDQGGVLIATSGRFEMLVTNINGEIGEGDYLTASPIAGIAMKADDRQARTLGQSLQNFDTSQPSQILTTREVTSTEGEKLSAAVGRVLVDLDIRNNPLSFGILAPEILIELGETIAGGPVSVTRIWGALGVLALSFVTGSVIFYAGIRTSLIAIGRNPLSKTSVLKGFLQVTAISLIIFVVGGFAVYLILKL